jgi:hypothetical protein
MKFSQSKKLPQFGQLVRHPRHGEVCISNYYRGHHNQLIYEFSPTPNTNLDHWPDAPDGRVVADLEHTLEWLITSDKTELDSDVSKRLRALESKDYESLINRVNEIEHWIWLQEEAKEEKLVIKEPRRRVMINRMIISLSDHIDEDSFEYQFNRLIEKFGCQIDDGCMVKL